MTVAAIVPARDEAERIGATVAALRSIPNVAEVVVVDDGSRDATASIAASAGARVERIRGGRGKGGALEAGVRATGAPVLLFADADLAATASEAVRLLSPVLDGSADLTIARLPRAGGASGFGLVEGFARTGIAALAGRRMDRPISGQRAMRRDVAEACLPFAPGFGVEVAMTICALRKGFRVAEIDCAMTHAKTGRDLRGFSHRARQGAHIASALLRCAVRRR